MKKLKVYKQDNDFVLERINEFNHSTKRVFATEYGLLEGLEAYGASFDEYNVQIDLESKYIKNMIVKEVKEIANLKVDRAPGKQQEMER